MSVIDNPSATDAALLQKPLALSGLRQSAIDRLACWAEWSEQWWYQLPGQTNHGFFGTGYDRWGTQTNQKYVAAMATLGQFGPVAGRKRARCRALASLRYEVETHCSNQSRRCDGSQWGRHWLSALGIERMMHAWPLLRPHMDEQLLEGIERVLLSEAQWAAQEHERGRPGIMANRWAHEGNVPESNLWEGALLWRVAEMFPQHELAETFREQAIRFLINAVSVRDDATDTSMVDGRRVKDLHLGANFFDHYALDHHGYLNVGYMGICISNAAMLHFDLKRLGFRAPEALHHHQEDLWKVFCRMIFQDGRLARIGGDSRIPYSYCQEYLLPSLLYIIDRFNDPTALTLLSAAFELALQEEPQDGSFMGDRLGSLAQRHPYYYTRLETDRACSLSMLINYLPQLEYFNAEPEEGSRYSLRYTTPELEESSRGLWVEPEYGAALHRSPSRLASVVWRAYDGPQVLCLPPDAGDLADWQCNGVGLVRCLGDQPNVKKLGPTRRVLTHDIQTYDGGFLSSATVAEGEHNEVPEGLTLRHQATSRYAVCALPDNHTMLVLHRCTARLRIYTHEVVGLHLKIANDLFNDSHRVLHTERAQRNLDGPPASETIEPLDSRWLCVDNRLGVVGLRGSRSLTLHRSPDRRGGAFNGLHTEVVGYPHTSRLQAWDAGAVIIDNAYAILSDTDAATTKDMADSCESPVDSETTEGLHASEVCGLDGHRYLLVANLSPECCTTDLHGRLMPGEAILCRDGIQLARTLVCQTDTQADTSTIPTR